MRHTLPLLVALLGLVASEALAREIPQPPALELPVGARVRLRTQASGGEWIKGVLASADSSTISIVPENAPPLGANQLRLPGEAVTRLELVTGKKRQWLPGLLIGAAVGVTMGLAMDVDPVKCEFDDNYFCSRGGALAAIGGTVAVLGTLGGVLIQKDVWTPVALDALGPPPAHVARTGLGLRAVPGGLGLTVSVGF